jgi:hypothetical protein
MCIVSLMLNHFAGPITEGSPDFPWWFLAVLVFIGIGWVVVVSLGSVGIFRFLFKTRVSNKKMATKNGKNLLANNYLAGALIDGVAAAGILFILVRMNKFGEWSNDAWHHTVETGAVVYFFLRLVPRTIFGVSLGEMSIRAKKYTKKNYIRVTVIDLLIVSALYLYVRSL